MTDVKRVFVEKRSSNPKEFLGRIPQEGDWDTIVDYDADVYCGDELICVFRKAEPKKVAYLLDAVRRVKFNDLKRMGAQHMASRSKVFGFSPRVPLRRNYCSKCAFAREDPELNERLSKWANVSDDFLREHCPAKHAWFTDYAAQIRPEWRINDTVFTSGYINDTCSLTYHVDKSELPKAWNVVTVMKHGVKGGMTVLPEYRVALNAEGPVMFGFSAPADVHGVTPITKISKDAYRYSVVFYTMKEMVKCGSLEEELDRIREWSTSAEKRFVSKKDA